jgi:hypothetical protein
MENIDIQYGIPYNPFLKKGILINQRRNANEYEPKGIYKRYFNDVVCVFDRGRSRVWG